MAGRISESEPTCPSEVILKVGNKTTGEGHVHIFGMLGDLCRNPPVSHRMTLKSRHRFASVLVLHFDIKLLHLWRPEAYELILSRCSTLSRLILPTRYLLRSSRKKARRAVLEARSRVSHGSWKISEPCSRDTGETLRPLAMHMIHPQVNWHNNLMQTYNSGSYSGMGHMQHSNRNME